MSTQTTTTVLPATRQPMPESFVWTVGGYKVDNRVGCWGQAVCGLYLNGKLDVTVLNSPTGGPAVLEARDQGGRQRIRIILEDLKAAGIKPKIGGEWTEETLADAVLIEGEEVKSLNRRSNVVFATSTADLEANILRIFSKSSSWSPERIDQALSKYPGSLYWSKPQQRWVEANA